jgi:hypothetical protein
MDELLTQDVEFLEEISVHVKGISTDTKEVSLAFRHEDINTLASISASRLRHGCSISFGEIATYVAEFIFSQPFAYSSGPFIYPWQDHSSRRGLQTQNRTRLGRLQRQ